MITIKTMTQDQASKLKEIDRSEHIDLIYEMHKGRVVETFKNHECSNWSEDLLKEIQERYLFELSNGGIAIGAFDGESLVGFGVLAHKFRGRNKDQLQIDLMYVTRNYRRLGIGTQIMNELSNEARKRGAEYLYISSTETKSAVSFYKQNGSQIAEEIDEELFTKEPKDIHMIRKL
ncbi:GNAT family N-acetyltransferase [Cohnella terricola]|uniref:GNAT family N-acetyltransferase n=1 Tax=Cohnella terricola TaxID=1289167 RepID=A0A559J8U2_9BACL|nr:GNAT family N-acetyltransferase [Cohnella terricola]TVX96294.1 GNAT family N-acetyltransferase [Cohnella terricola]